MKKNNEITILDYALKLTTLDIFWTYNYIDARLIQAALYYWNKEYYKLTKKYLFENNFVQWEKGFTNKETYSFIKKLVLSGYLDKEDYKHIDLKLDFISAKVLMRMIYLHKNYLINLKQYAL